MSKEVYRAVPCPDGHLGCLVAAHYAWVEELPRRVFELTLTREEWREEWPPSSRVALWLISHVWPFSRLLRVTVMKEETLSA